MLLTANASRCDGLRPSCTPCNELDYECNYDAQESSSNIIVPKDYVNVLEKRLKQVEGLLQRHDDLLTGHLSSCSPGLSEQDHRRDATSSISGIQAFSGVPELSNGNEDAEEAATDGLAITFVDEQASAYFGQSSNICFTRYLLKAASSIWNIKQPQNLSTGAGKHSTGQETSIAVAEYSPLAIGSPQHDVHTASLLPPELEMEDMIRAYFASTGLLFPFLHEESFRRAYRDFKESGFTKVRKTWLGVLNIMFAMASNTDRKGNVTAKERFEKSLVFYKRAATLCNGPSFNTVSLDIVHYLLLQVLYLQGTQHSVQAWSVHGLLVRTAVALGIQSDQAGSKRDPIEQQVRRRTWQTIYCLDKVLSTTFGRPPAITEDQMTVAAPSSWPLPAVTGANASSDAPYDTTEFLNVSVSLYTIMGHVIETQYGGNVEARIDSAYDIAALQAAENTKAKLHDWVSTLPQAFSILVPNSPNLLYSSPSQRLRTILTLRYHSVKMLIHRPFLSAILCRLSILESQSRNQPPHSLRAACDEEAHACVSSAQETIDIMANIMLADTSKNNNLGVWFFNLYYRKCFGTVV